MNRLTQLMRLRQLALDSEQATEPGTPERAARARRTDRIAAAYRAEAKRWEPRR